MPQRGETHDPPAPDKLGLSEGAESGGELPVPTTAREARPSAEELERQIEDIQIDLALLKDNLGELADQRKAAESGGVGVNKIEDIDRQILQEKVKLAERDRDLVGAQIRAGASTEEFAKIGDQLKTVERDEEALAEARDLRNAALEVATGESHGASDAGKWRFKAAGRSPDAILSKDSEESKLVQELSAERNAAYTDLGKLTPRAEELKKKWGDIWELKADLNRQIAASETRKLAEALAAAAQIPTVEQKAPVGRKPTAPVKAGVLDRVRNFFKRLGIG